MATKKLPKQGRNGGSSPASGSVSLTALAIAKLFQGTNFGPTGDCPYGRRGLMVECVLKHAAGYADGSTINQICTEAGLLGKYGPTRKGMRWAFDQIYDVGGGNTIVQRLSSQNA